MSLARAIKTGDVGELPSRRDEEWRWTDLRGLIRVLPSASLEVRCPSSPGPFAALTADEVVVINGRGPAVIKVASEQTRTIALRFIGIGAGAHVSDMTIEVGEGARLLLLETYEGEGDYLAETELRIALDRGARMERVVLAHEPAGAVSVSRADVALSGGAAFAQTILASGAKRQRIETWVNHPGAGATARLDGVYLLDGKRHSDLTSVVTHVGVDGMTDQLTKGVVSDQARGVFQGRIVVSTGADKTDARMGHHVLVLSDRAEVDAKPELEIHADDVACAHGNTVGALDEEALFYARQRGIPEAQAKALLTEAFLGAVVDRIEDDGARALAGDWIAARLKSAP